MFPAHSQIIYKTGPRVRTLISSNGDTLVEMNLADARVILNDLFDKQVSDSIMVVLTKRDSLNTGSIMLLKNEINLLNIKLNNQDLIDSNLQLIVSDKNKELSDLNDIIKQQKKEIRKQKIQKVFGFIAAIVLPITILIILH